MPSTLRPRKRRAYMRMTALRGGLDGEVEMLVIAAGRVEGGVAVRAAGIAREIVGDGESCAASAAEDGGFVEFGMRPRFERMAREGVVAIVASVEEAAAAHLDGDDVESRVVMEAAGLRVEVEAVNERRGRRHLQGDEKILA